MPLLLFASVLLSSFGRKFGDVRYGVVRLFVAVLALPRSSAASCGRRSPSAANHVCQTHGAGQPE